MRGLLDFSNIPQKGFILAFVFTFAERSEQRGFSFFFAKDEVASICQTRGTPGQNSPPGLVALVCNWPNVCATPVIGPRWLHSDSLNGCTASPLPLAPSATHLALLLLGSKTPISLAKCTHTRQILWQYSELICQLCQSKTKREFFIYPKDPYWRIKEFHLDLSSSTILKRKFCVW